MKKLTLLPLILCMGSVALAGCTIGGSSNSKKKKSSSHSTGLTTDTSGESSESSGSGSSGSSTSGSSSSAPTEYTPELVANDFNDILKAEGEDYEPLCVEWDEEYEEYFNAVLWEETSDTSEATLKKPVEIISSYLPDYMAGNYAVYGDPTSPDYEPIFTDATDVYYYYGDFLSPDEKVVAYFIGYIYNHNGKDCSACQYGIAVAKASSN